MSQPFQIVIDTLSVGGSHALTASGIGIVFPVMQLANFAHAEFAAAATHVLLALSGSPIMRQQDGKVVDHGATDERRVRVTGAGIVGSVTMRLVPLVGASQPPLPRGMSIRTSH